MPRSKQRKHHHEHPRPASLEKTDKKRSAVLVSVIFFGILGMGIAFFATDSSILWLAVGAIVGGIAGYFFGKQLDRSLSNK